MFRPRLIPVLLIRDGGLVKTTRFGSDVYVGDPMNAVRLFNDLGADELAVLDIDAHAVGRTIDPQLVRQIGQEARMPFAVGGGIRTKEDAAQLIAGGAEKVVLNTAVVEDPKLLSDIASSFGAQSLIACIDAKKGLFGRSHAMIRGGKKDAGMTPEEFAAKATALGAGEIIIQSIDRDGMREGYDLGLIRSVGQSVTVPVIALGGAGGLPDLRMVIQEGGASAAAAGSLFVFYGPRKAVLVNYPSKDEKSALFA